MTTHHFAAGRHQEATAITTVLALPCGLACAGSVLPGLDDIVTAVVLALAALVLLALAAQQVARWVRERREDRADAITAAGWRAEHAAHLLTAADRAHLADRVRVRATRPVVGLDRQAVA